MRFRTAGYYRRCSRPQGSEPPGAFTFKKCRQDGTGAYAANTSGQVDTLQPRPYPARKRNLCGKESPLLYLRFILRMRVAGKEKKQCGDMNSLFRKSKTAFQI